MSVLIATRGRSASILSWVSMLFLHGLEARANIQTPPSAYLSKFYYDCLTDIEPALRMLIDPVGVERVVLGTDWPFDMGIDWPGSWILSLTSLTQREKEAILWKNLEQLLGI